MPKDAITLGTHFQAFVERQVTCGRYGSASEVVRAALRAALIEGERSGLAEEFDFETLMRSNEDAGRG